MHASEHRRTYVAKISDLSSELQSQLKFSLHVSGVHATFVPMGLPNHRGRPGNPFFHFNYQVAYPIPEALTFEVYTASGILLYTLNIAPEFRNPGHYELCWDGFDQQDVFDSRVFTQSLEARLIIVTENTSTQLTACFKCQYARVKWIDIKIDRRSNRIDALLITNFSDGGENKNGNRNRTYAELLKLAQEGLAYHWGRNTAHPFAKGITLESGERYGFYLKTDNRPLNAISSPKIIYQSNSRSRRSRNWELSRLLFYNTGALKYGSRWFHKSEKKADADFKQIAAHEIGHEILLAYGGHIHSKSHKGSSTILTQRPLGNFNYPSEGEIDLMIYYQENAQSPHPADYNERSVASENDVLSLIWLSQLKVVLLSDKSLSG